MTLYVAERHWKTPWVFRFVYSHPIAYHRTQFTVSQKRTLIAYSNDCRQVNPVSMILSLVSIIGLPDVWSFIKHFARCIKRKIGRDFSRW